MKLGLAFTIDATDGAARTGRLETRRGNVATPAFMPVGTAATVKAMTPEAVAQTGAEIVLCNTYHLMLRPGAERVARLGGLHHFMNWSGPILTDSGGFQVMSLAKLRQLDADGVTFQSHIDGASHRLTPERAIEIQHLLNADITMVLDECTPWPVERAGATASMRLSMDWAARSKAAYIARPEAGLFGIVQGSVYPELREASARALVDIGFDGYAIGGLAVGERQERTFTVLDATVPHLPDGRPRYLMGVGRPVDIVGAVRRGVDMFDCVLPTRSGRTGKVFTRRGELNIRNARHADDPRPLDEDCPCPTCGNYGRAYLHHLFKADEMLGPTLLTWHNLAYYQELMAGIRAAITRGGLDDFAAGFEESYEKGDIAAL